MKVTRIHYTGGLPQDRFLENCGGRRQPTLLRVKALMSDQGPEIQSRTFGLVFECENNDDVKENIPVELKPEPKRPLLTLIRGGFIEKIEQ